MQKGQKEKMKLNRLDRTDTIAVVIRTDKRDFARYTEAYEATGLANEKNSFYLKIFKMGFDEYVKANPVPVTTPAPVVADQPVVAFGRRCMSKYQLDMALFNGSISLEVYDRLVNVAK